MLVAQRDNRDRVKAAVAAAALEGLIGVALVTGLAMSSPAPVRERLTQIGILPPPPPPPPPPRPRPRETKQTHEREKRPEGAASPPNLEAKPTEILKPPPPRVVLPPPPPPVVTAPVTGPGTAPSMGAAPVPGPGTGSGGEGNGTGSGSGGNGPGGGGGGYGRGSPPKHIRGRIKDEDYPASAGAAGFQGVVWVRYTVLVSGRATNCRILHSSGNAEIDATTCRLIEQRFIYRPAQDERHRPVQADVVEDHEWVIIPDKRARPEPDD